MNFFSLGNLLKQIMYLALLTSSTRSEPRQVLVALHPAEAGMAKKFGLEPILVMPGLHAGLVSTGDHEILTKLFGHRVEQVPGSYPELDVSAKSVLLTTPDGAKEEVSNWYAANLTGQGASIGLLDSGVPDQYNDSQGRSFSRQPGLERVNLTVDRSPYSGFERYLNGVRTPHGTAVAGVYASQQETYRGLSFGIDHVFSTYAGDSTVDNTTFLLTLYNLQWLLAQKPNIINYSYGNGGVSCPELTRDCYNRQDWSLVAKIFDFISNHNQVLFVKSAGNGGWIAPSTESPHNSTMSIPADSYHAIVVANMEDRVDSDDPQKMTLNRTLHHIHYSSSRGPTRDGRRKPDIALPGTWIRTLAPDEETYATEENPTFKPYTPSMKYNASTNTREVTGTSIATPEVGAAVALLYSYGIKSPIEAKALIFNSADRWDDNGQPGPGDPHFPCNTTLPRCGHGPANGSQWNPTYGWGYMNMDTAYTERDNVFTRFVINNQTMCFSGFMPAYGKVTLVWDRRVGLERDESGFVRFFNLTSMRLALYGKEKTLLAEDPSQIDNVLQVANPLPSDQHVVVTVQPTQKIDGAELETVALASSCPLQQTICDDVFGQHLSKENLFDIPHLRSVSAV